MSDTARGAALAERAVQKRRMRDAVGMVSCMLTVG